MLALFATTLAAAQRIERQKSFWETTYSVDGDKLKNMGKLVDATASVQNAQVLIEKVKINYIPITLLSRASRGFIVGSLSGLIVRDKNDKVN